MEKRGQFYIIGAIIIITVAIGLASVTNYAQTRKKSAKFYDLSSELNQESSRVVDYGIYNEQYLPMLIEDFTDNYFINYTEEKEKGTELVLVYGNRNNVTVAIYTSEKTGKVDINYGMTSFVHTGTDKYVVNRTSKIPEGDLITVKVLGVEYNFNLQKGENFFFVITKKTEEETYITKSQ